MANPEIESFELRNATSYNRVALVLLTSEMLCLQRLTHDSTLIGLNAKKTLK